MFGCVKYIVPKANNINTVHSSVLRQVNNRSKADDKLNQRRTIAHLDIRVTHRPGTKR